MSETCHMIGSILSKASAMLQYAEPSLTSQQALSIVASCQAMEDYARRCLRTAARQDTCTITGLKFQWDPDRCEAMSGE